MSETQIPTLEQALQAFREADARQAFWTAHHGELRQRYPDQFIAIHDGAVIASANHLDEVIEAAGALGFQARQIDVRFAARESEHFIL